MPLLNAAADSFGRISLNETPLHTCSDCVHLPGKLAIYLTGLCPRERAEGGNCPSTEKFEAQCYQNSREQNE